MSAEDPAESASPEDELASRLAAFDEALAAGQTTPLPSDPAVPSELRSRLEHGMTCLQLLEEHWRSPRPGASGPFFLADAGGAVGDPGAVPQTEQPLTRLGRFQIRRELGRGGFGIVFLAHDPSLNRDVALKIPRPEVLVSPASRHRFQHEAQAAGRLDHPNVVPVYEVGEISGLAYIASAYCPGISLADWLHDRKEPVPARNAAGWIATLADAVQHAHSRGVLHRDLKPSNVLLVSSGVVSGESSHAPESGSAADSGLTPKITDFGLAKLVAKEEAG